MSDFRQLLYEKYFSSFKSHLSTFDDKVIRIQHNMYKLQYLPLLKSYNKSASILELGCGPGILLDFLRDKGFGNTLGIDLSAEQVENASEKKLNVELANVLDYIKSTEKTFDIIFAIDLIEHFHKDELIPLFEGIYNNLRIGGAFVFHTPNGLGINANRIIYGDLTHSTIFTPNSAMQILKLVGFNEIKFFETEPYAKDVNGTLRLLLWKIVKLFFNVIRLIETGGTEKILTQNFIGYAKKG